MLRKACVVAIFVLVVAGCGTKTKAHFESFPTAPTDFELCPEELRKRYSDIDRYDGPFSRGIFSTIYSMPPMEELNDTWGAPDKKRVSWRSVEAPAVTAAIGLAFGLPGGVIVGFSVFAAAAHPYSVHTWNKGYYEINCVVDSPMAFGYSHHLDYWRWNYNGPECNKKGEIMSGVRKHAQSNKSSDDP